MPKIVEFDDDRDSVGADAPSGDPETLLLRKQEVGPINGARERLSTVFREAIVLRELEGLSYTEIVTVTDVPIGTVAKRLKARKQSDPGRFDTCRWTESGMQFWAISDLGTDELRAFASLSRGGDREHEECCQRLLWFLWICVETHVQRQPDFGRNNPDRRSREKVQVGSFRNPSQSSSHAIRVA